MISRRTEKGECHIFREEVKQISNPLSNGEGVKQNPDQQTSDGRGDKKNKLFSNAQIHYITINEIILAKRLALYAIFLKYSLVLILPQ